MAGEVCQQDVEVGVRLVFWGVQVAVAACPGVVACWAEGALVVHLASFQEEAQGAASPAYEAFLGIAEDVNDKSRYKLD